MRSEAQGKIPHPITPPQGGGYSGGDSSFFLFAREGTGATST